MTRLWIREIVRHKIARQIEMPCDVADVRENFSKALIDLDLPQPMWLNKHEKEFESFRRTSFAPDHFVEPVKFDRIEMELFDDDEKKRKEQMRTGRYYDE